MLKLGPSVIDSVPVQSAATVQVPTPPVASIIIVPPMFPVPNGLNVVPSPLNRRQNEDSFGRAAETNTRTCEHNGKSAAIRESIVLPR